MSGHSKWAQIKHKKSTTDAKRGALFSKLVREITIAAREGGGREEANPRLRAALSRGRAAGLSKDNMERALARAEKNAGGETLSEFLYEATRPGGIMILIEGITDNKKRTHAEIKHILSERAGRMAEQGSLACNFEKIGTLEIARDDNPNKTPEELELAAIDAGARDVRRENSLLVIETAFAEREDTREALERRGITIREIGHDYKAKSAIALSEDERASLEPLLDALANHDDVREVYTNRANN